MIADFYTKPIQGSLFKRLSSAIMGEISLAEFNNLVGSKERVENQKNRKNDPYPIDGEKKNNVEEKERNTRKFTRINDNDGLSSTRWL